MILFFDIDGTLWDYKNWIPDTTKEGIRRAKENGHKCFINSGRSRSFISNKELLGLGFDGIISAGGCMIEKDGEIIFNRLIDSNEAIRTVETVRRYGFRPILEGPRYLYMERSDFEGNMYGEKVMAEMGERLHGIDECWGKWEMNKLSCATIQCDTKGCFAELDDLYDFIIHNEYVVEMVPKGFNKGTGISKVCELLSEDINNTIAFGDSVNDVDMLEVAGKSVVMGRAPEEVKNIADYVTTNLEEDGIWNALKKFDLI
ncbi:MAG: HAD family hydrolase [Butyrivibrio sp.]|nr:HAD family hydrolase [Butyrivibrio sp.]